MQAEANKPIRRRFNFNRYSKAKAQAVSLLARVKREKLSSKEYLELRKDLLASKDLQKLPLHVGSEIMHFLNGGIEAYNLFDIVFCYTINGKHYEVRSPEYDLVVDYSTVKQWEHTGRLAWKEDLNRTWFQSEEK